jgi:amino acid adenylation domain-containing protein
MAVSDDAVSIINWPNHGQMHDLAIPAWFEQRAAAHPDSVAVVSDLSRCSYGELNAAANRLAHEIIARGGTPGDRVAILMRHDLPIVVTTLAVLKAGRVVVVLNPGDPEARLRQVIANAGIALIVADEATRTLANVLAESGIEIVEAEESMRSENVGSTGIVVPADQLAFLIYTSGSTGEPKGVMRTHRQALQNGLRMSRSVGVRSDDRIALLFAMSSEVGVTLTWAALLNGASLHPFPVSERGAPALPAWLHGHSITVFSVTASIYRQFIKSLSETTTLPSVRVLRFGSEEVSSQDFKDYQKHFTDNCTLLHSFGSSEAGIVMHRQLSRADTVADGALAVGRPAYGIEIFLVDEQGNQVPDGGVGEIILKSTSLSDGYWNDSALTASKFIEWPRGSGSRAFQTGDLARIGSDGLLSFVGRRDMQVKIGGYRVEMSEVEQALAGLNGVRQAAAMFTRAGDRTEIAAFVVLEAGTIRTPVELRRQLAKSVPRQMVPSRFLLLDQIPIAPAGKVDRERLRQILQSGTERESGKPPVTETETMLAGFWADVLELTVVSRDDDFFELGGDSLKATVVSAWVFDALEVEIHLGTFADHPVLSDLAAAIDQIHQAGSTILLPPLIPASREQPLPLSLNQQHAWMASQTSEGLKAYTATEGRTIQGPLDREVLREGMSILAERHELLRTIFPEIDGRPVQFVLPFTSFDLPFIDLADKADAMKQAQRLLDREVDRAFDLEKGPLIYFTLIRISANEHWLLSTFHHILTDPWSWDVYFRELGYLYEARLRGEPVQLKPMPIQYGDFSAWQQQILRSDSPAYQASLERWMPSLSGVPHGLKLPFARAQHCAGLDPLDGVFKWELERNVGERLDELEEESGTSYFTVRIAAFAAAFAAETGQSDFAVGTYLTHRNRVALQDVFGPFVYLVALRFKVDLQQSFRDWLATVWQIVTAAEGNGSIPLDRLNAGLHERGLEPPEIKVIFNVLKNQVRAQFGGLELRKIASKMIGMPQGFHINLDQNRHVWGAAFDAGAYEPSKVKAFVERYCQLLKAVSAQPDVPMEQFLAIKKSREPASGWRSFFRLRA